jgi:GNAT superfamily N-acetyltransferase
MKSYFQDRKGGIHTVRMRAVAENDNYLLYDIVSSTVIEQVKLMGGDVRQLAPLLQMQFENQTMEYRERFPKAEHFIIMMNDVDAGRIYLDRNSEEIHILDITLLPEFRGKGLGTFILKSLEEEAERKRAPICIYVEDGNPSLRLFRRLGYRFKSKFGEAHNLMEWNPIPSPSS